MGEDGKARTDGLLKEMQEFAYKASLYGRAHKLVAESARRRNFALSVSVILLSAITGSSLFIAASSAQRPGMLSNVTAIQIALGTIAILSAFLAALQSAIRLPEKEQRNKEAGDRYSNCKRFIDQAVVDLKYGEIDLKAALAVLRDGTAAFETVRSESPGLDDGNYRRAKASFRTASEANAGQESTRTTIYNK